MMIINLLEYHITIVYRYVLIFFVNFMLFLTQVVDMELEYFPPGTDIISLDDPPTYFYILVTGVVVRVYILFLLNFKIELSKRLPSP